MLNLSAIDKHPFILIVLVGIIVSLPLILVGLPYESDDGVSHFLYQTNFAEQFWRGEIYPRWLTFINGGFGGPTFFYYPPLPYYITSVFALLPTNSWHHLGLSSSLGLIVSGFTAFVWLRELTPSRPALVAALLYMLAPYHLNFDIYARAAFAEFYGFVWMPLILYFAHRLIHRGLWAFFGLAISFAALCGTHLLTTMMFGIVPLLYIAARSPKSIRSWAVLTGIAALILGAGLAAVFILPAIAYIDWVHLYKAKEGHFQFENWLMTHTLFVNGSLKYFWMPFTVSSVALFCFLSTRLQMRGDQKREARIWLIVMCGSVLMMTHLSYPIWAIIEPLQMIQFPWRFNTVLCVSALPLIAIGVWSMQTPLSRMKKFTIGLIVFLTVVSTADLGVKYWRKFINPPDISRNHRRYKQFVERQDTHPQWPRSVTYGLSPGTQRSGLPDMETSKLALPSFRENEVTAFAVNGTVAVNRVNSRLLEVTARAALATSVTITQFHYPGWIARSLGSNKEIPIYVRTDLGLISFDLPAGDHKIAVTLDKLPAETAGEWISIVSLLVLISLAFFTQFSMRSRPPVVENDIPEI